MSQEIATQPNIFVIFFKGAWRPVLDVFSAILIGLSVGAIVMLAFGYDPIAAYRGLLIGAFGKTRAIADTLSAATPLILTGLTFAIGVRAGLFNIGAQGQMLIGAIAATAVAGYVPLPPYIHHAAVMIAAMLAGALWSVPAAFLKSIRGVHEVISTIMLNWIGRWLVIYLAVRILSDPNRAEKTVTAMDSAQFATVVNLSTYTHFFWICILVAIFVYWFLWHTPIGYSLRATGLNEAASRYGGIKPTRSMYGAFILGGMTAGLAGASQLIGRHNYAITTDLGTLANMGFDGIAVALIGRNHPLGCIFGALFFGALNAGTRMMQLEAQVPLEMTRVIQGVIVLAIAIPQIWKMFPAIGRHTRKGLRAIGKWFTSSTNKERA
jgi:simple sugar transport system permease protein